MWYFEVQHHVLVHFYFVTPKNTTSSIHLFHGTRGSDYYNACMRVNTASYFRHLFGTCYLSCTFVVVGGLKRHGHVCLDIDMDM